MENYGKTLINWYSANKRDLPWRNTTDPFKIWLSEVILQQTRVDQGLSYYRKFTERFRNAGELARAEESEVLKLWQGLGYYSRARNLHKAARRITSEYDGRFPDNYDELQKLNGIGPYTAAAIASFAFGERVPAIDGNVYRLLSRYLGVTTPVNTPKAYREFFSAADSLMSRSDPAAFNQASMELGAMICKPKSPECESCPIARSCFALNNGKIDELPVKLKKGEVKKRYFTYFIHNPRREKIALSLRTNRDIWRHLYQFPLIETERALPEEDLKREAARLAGVSDEGDIEINAVGEERVHKLSHQELHARFYEIHTRDDAEFPGGEYVPRHELPKYPLPRLIERFIQEEKPEYFTGVD